MELYKVNSQIGKIGRDQLKQQNQLKLSKFNQSINENQSNENGFNSNKNGAQNQQNLDQNSQVNSHYYNKDSSYMSSLFQTSALENQFQNQIQQKNNLNSHLNNNFNFKENSNILQNGELNLYAQFVEQQRRKIEENKLKLKNQKISSRTNKRSSSYQQFSQNQKKIEFDLDEEAEMGQKIVQLRYNYNGKKSTSKNSNLNKGDLSNKNINQYKEATPEEINNISQYQQLILNKRSMRYSQQMDQKISDNDFQLQQQNLFAQALKQFPSKTEGNLQSNMLKQQQEINRNDNYYYQTEESLDDSLIEFQSNSSSQYEKFLNYNDIEKEENIIKNAKIGDLAFEDFVVIGPDLEKLIQQNINNPKQQLPDCIDPKIQYNYLMNKKLPEDTYQFLNKSAFPFEVPLKSQIIEVENNKLSQNIKEVIFPHFYANHKKNFQRTFVFNLYTDFTYKQEYSINNVMLQANPNSILYGVCLQAYDYILIPINYNDKQQNQELINQQQRQKLQVQKKNSHLMLNKQISNKNNNRFSRYKEKDTSELVQNLKNQKLQPGKYLFVKFPKIFCFVTYFPFYKFFSDISQSILDNVTTQNVNFLMQNNYLDVCNQLNYLNQSEILQQNMNFRQNLFELQKQKPQFSQFLYFNTKNFLIQQPVINQWVPHMNTCQYMEGLWGANLVMSSFSFSDFWFIMTCILLEFRIVFFSENPTFLTGCILTFQSLIKPFKYIHPIRLNLSIDYIQLLESPFPVLIGINKQQKELKTIIRDYQLDTSEFIFVDLDHIQFFYSNLEYNQQNRMRKEFFQERNIEIPQFREEYSNIEEIYLQINPSKQARHNQNPNQKVKHSKNLVYHSHQNSTLIQEIFEKIENCLQDNIIIHIPNQPIYDQYRRFQTTSCGSLLGTLSSANLLKEKKNSMEKTDFGSRNEMDEIKNSNEDMMRSDYGSGQKNKLQDIDFRKIQQIIVSKNILEKKFLDLFLCTQIFTYYVEQKYKYQIEQDERNKIQQELIQPSISQAKQKQNQIQSTLLQQNQSSIQEVQD
ncbi:hypothetical protein PPERSA_00419 [Pseudocohnilembus persalinus]|uniref:UDENN domain-containing protein n=1 Tax=Pseudocohnilembus persalinus TaxID=266149 RepID=A0A0V0QYH4_PSEPJ|nr:hypothetical protein PPERSA_00419 [Pseudocohnilembus persalinus]|eukprot:KRX07262.1 hypothetical protein PPERSA_00419 [Pseudocohnilembus persalinus]